MKLKSLIYAPLCLILSSFEKKVALKKLLLFKLKIHFRPNPQLCALFIIIPFNIYRLFFQSILLQGVRKWNVFFEIIPVAKLLDILAGSDAF